MFSLAWIGGCAYTGGTVWEEVRVRILLVEDDRPLGQAVLGYLKSKQFSVDWAENLQQAKGFAATVPYAAVLLDLNLPDGEGLHLLPLLHESAAHGDRGDGAGSGQRPHPRLGRGGR